jgi:hypothetical protein
MLFTLFIEFVLRVVIRVPPGEQPQVGQVKLGSTILEILGYADDLTLVNTTPHGLQDRLTKIAEVSKQAGLVVALSKTKTLTQQNDPHMNDADEFTLGGTKLEKVAEFSLLGSMQSDDGLSSTAVQERIKKATKVFYGLKKVWRMELSNEVKGNVFRAMVKSVLLYGAATWTTTQGDIQALEGFQMVCVRSILRVSRLEHQRNIDLRHRLGIDCNMRECVARERVRYFGHVWRMDPGRRAKALLLHELYGCKGSRPSKGRPSRTWVHCIQDDLSLRGFGVSEAGKIAEDCRDKFRDRVVYGRKRSSE